MEKHHISLPAHHGIRAMAIFYSDPRRAYALLRSDLIKTTNVTKSGCYLKYFQDLRYRRIGTPEVESVAKKEYYGGRDTWQSNKERRRCQGVELEVIRILDIRVAKEVKNLKEVRHLSSTGEVALKEKLQVLDVVTEEGVTLETVMNKYKEEVAKEVSMFKKVYSAYYKHKVDTLYDVFKLRRQEKENPRWRGVLVTDEQLREEEVRREEEPGCNFIVLDDIVLDRDEESYLRLPYKFRELDIVNFEDVEAEAEMNTVKQRWDLMGRGREDEEGEDVTEEVRKNREEEERKRTKKERDDAGKVHDIKGKTLDMSKQRVTELSMNPRTIEPRAAQGIQEIKIQSQKLEEINQCMRKIKIKEKDGRETNLTRSEEVGKLKLLKRKKKGEIVMFPTDKSGKIVVSLPETYQRAAQVHLQKDLDVSWSELKVTETRINRHMKALVKIVNLGEQHSGQSQRITGATKSVDSPAPALYLLWKDHKPYTTEPPTRPVCSATVGPLARASEITSSILTAYLDSIPPGTECMSTEEMQRAILDANQMIKDQDIKDVEVFSMDVHALYPSLHLDDILDSVYSIMVESEISMENLNYEEMSK